MAQASDGSVSWASKAVESISKNDRNVMDIMLEKDTKGAFALSDVEVARVLQKLGADMRPGVHIEGVQICPMGKNVIQVMLNKKVDIDHFSKKELFEVKSGVRISEIRKSGQSEVTLSIKGLHPSTPDTKVFEYLQCLGKMDKKRVIMDTFKSGPLSGLQNGVRKYQLLLRSDIVVGPFHVIDGQKVSISFTGQRRFCFRCLKISRECLGRGIARDCEEAGGDRVIFSDFIKQYWNIIGYSPANTVDPNEMDSLEDEIIVDMNLTTPKPFPKEKVEKWGGVTLKWFPKGADNGDIRSFLITHGLPETHQDILFESKGQVVIQQLSADICKLLSDSVNGKKFKDRRLIYCNPYIPLTPEKRGNDINSDTSKIMQSGLTLEKMPNQTQATSRDSLYRYQSR